MVNGYTCPYCDDRMPLRDFNTFYVRHKELVDREWDFVNNYVICDPNEILDSCSILVWFICLRNSKHRYKMTPAQRLEKEERGQEPCPICRGYRKDKNYFYRKKKLKK